jgi:hypothetical protein
MFFARWHLAQLRGTREGRTSPSLARRVGVAALSAARRKNVTRGCAASLGQSTISAGFASEGARRMVDAEGMMNAPGVAAEQAERKPCAQGGVGGFEGAYPVLHAHGGRAGGWRRGRFAAVAIRTGFSLWLVGNIGSVVGVTRRAGCGANTRWSEDRPRQYGKACPCQQAQPGCALRNAHDVRPPGASSANAAAVTPYRRRGCSPFRDRPTTDPRRAQHRLPAAAPSRPET